MSSPATASDPAFTGAAGPIGGVPSVAAPAVGFRSALRRLWRRPYSPVGPAILYLLVAVGMIYPFWPSKFRNAGDMFVVLGMITEADRALGEGQFPIRVAPTQHGRARYAFFQFYGNFPYTLAAAITRALPGERNPYLAWKIATVASLTLGGLYAWRLCRRLTRANRAAVPAGVLFVTAPYMFADFVGRGAYSELVAFNLLPAVFYRAWRAFCSPGVRHVCASSIAWALLGLSHNIAYMFAVSFLGLWFLLYAAPS